MHLLEKSVRDRLPTPLLVHYEQLLSLTDVMWEHIDQTAIVDGSMPFTADTACAAEKSLAAISPVSSSPHGQNWYSPGGPMEHFRLCAFIAGEIAQAWGENPYLGQTIGWYHDLGRCITHEFLLTDLFTTKILSRIGVSTQVTNNLHRIEWFLSTAAQKINPHNLSKLQIVSLVADLLAKRSTRNFSVLRRQESLFEEIAFNRIKYQLDKGDIDVHIDTVNERELITSAFSRLSHDGVDETIIEEILLKAELQLLDNT